MIHKRNILSLVLLCSVACIKVMAASSDISDSPGPITSGIVIIDGNYLPPPYTVSRDGTNLRINGQILKKPVRHPGGPVLSLETPLIADVDEAKSKENLIKWLDTTLPVYKYYLEKDYCLLFFSEGQLVRLDPYRTAFEFSKSLEIIKSQNTAEDKISEYKRFNIPSSARDGFGKLALSEELTAILDNKAQQLMAAQEKQCGKYESNSIDSGYVFIEGEYIESPYTVTQTGTALAINGHLIRTPYEIPATVTGDKDPECPEGISEFSSIYDPVFMKYMAEKGMYVKSHHSRNEALEIIKVWFENIPFLRTVEINREFPSVVDVITTENQEISVEMLPMSRSPVTAKDFANDKRVTRYKDRLNRGTCFFFFDRGSDISFNSNIHNERLLKIVSISKSGKSAEDKEAELGKVFTFMKDKSLKKVLNMRSLSQLESRLSQE